MMGLALCCGPPTNDSQADAERLHGSARLTVDTKPLDLVVHMTSGRELEQTYMKNSTQKAIDSTIPPSSWFYSV